MEQLLIVDDNEDIRKQLKWGLLKEYGISLAGDCNEALRLFREHNPKVVTLDLGLPPDPEGTEEGFRCLTEILRERPSTKVIIISGNEDRESALKAIKIGAYDFYQKPIVPGEIRIMIKRAFHLYDIEEENRNLHKALVEKDSGNSIIVGQCPMMLEVFSTIRKVATSDASILITGESGTGKELVAREIHQKSLRKDGPFVPINCGAIPENLLESELFGHEKGAFTGAQAQINGKVEYAHKGTLFLDEIAELPVNLQVKLLRFLQDKTIQRVGGREDIHVDARIIAATNVDIAASIQEKKFREDLYYRLGVIVMHLPPLRERQDDLMLLSNLFLGRLNKALGKKVKGFSPESINIMEAYDWPGNVRELENKVQRGVLMSEAPFIGPQDLGFMMRGNEKAEYILSQVKTAMTLKEARERVEKELIVAVIEKNLGNIAKAAEDLGVSRPTLYDLLKKYGTDKNLPREI